ncbi:MAG: hypothetical protein HOC77_00205 [Chloroflexi bacterium]|jgi:uncharacterized membrane protein|nr:hypothetical protein [Chloroflexota bacterium]MBT4072330.1 hypothetical protein [Chloroflexota bacterium]MBT4513497.1 hypothetical protein [Chloroflexota bacterium]MBT6682632.1 hypothetical protein [Chloroflexota bacterium]
MDTELVIMRILHIAPGVVWVGSAFFAAFILNPRLRALGPEMEMQVTASINKVWGPVVHGAAAITIIVGFLLISRTPSGGFGDLFNTDWGWAIGIGLVASFIALIFGGLAGFSQARGRRLSEESPDAAGQASLDMQAAIYEKLHAVVALVAVAAMAAARWV